MKIFKKLFGEKKSNIKNKPIEQSAMKGKNEAVAVKFSVRILDVAGFPFELMLNTELSDIYTHTHKNYNWLWTVTIKSLDNNEEGLPTVSERKKLMDFMQQIIQTVLKENDIRVVGTSIHKEMYDIMFYAKQEDTANIGGTIAGMPSYMEDVKGRFLNYNGIEDAEWESVQLYSEAFKN